MTHPSLPGQDALGFSPDGSIARLYFGSRFQDLFEHFAPGPFVVFPAAAIKVSGTQ